MIVKLVWLPYSQYIKGFEQIFKDLDIAYKTRQILKTKLSFEKSGL